MDGCGRFGKLRLCDNRSRTYDLSITNASQLQNEYKPEYKEINNLNKSIKSTYYILNHELTSKPHFSFCINLKPTHCRGFFFL